MRKNDSFFLRYLEHEGKKIRRFLASKDLLIFLFFLLVSTGMWTLQASKRDYITSIVIPIEYQKAPEGFIQQAELPKNLIVEITDNATTLLRYRLYSWLHSFNPIEIDISTYTDGRFDIQTTDFQSIIQQKQLNSTTRILQINPPQISLEFEELTKKEVPVTFKGNIFLAPQYMKNGELEIKPSQVIVYGKKADVDHIEYAETEYTEIKDVSGTLNKTLRLAKADNITFSQDSVNCIQHTERFTEKSVEVPVFAKKAKKGYKLRTFPVTVKVKFHIGLSNYDNVNADDLTVTANYEDATGSRIPLRVACKKEGINNIEIIPANVEFLLEKND